ncbi:hypothetical protein CXF85_20145 [Colwellia sp. 75C3]|uniref:MipA/OmpV family protein n=1 Tax=Colwellia sp. 75C3 TaxID=888425 RepID=UPI000C31F0EA|nr:MipA/OmpV family protein [Colwellia sp. 75C3]PKG81073.1 hypothetical protein CXF85_20145 [Colwellia sp. 75C3]
MKHLTKTAVVSLVATSVILTSFTAIADSEVEKKANESTIPASTTEQGTSKSVEAANNTDEKIKKDDIAETDITVDSKNTDGGSEGKQESESNGDDDYSFCIGDCEGEEHQSYSCDEEDEKCEKFEKIHRFFDNRRDGFYVDVSAVSSAGDDYAFAANVDTESEFDVVMSYRVQLLGLFMESPGISTRRIQGMYSMPAWGVNFYNSEDYSFDMFYQYSTRGIEGLEGIQTRNEDERAGLRMTGFYENSQLQMIYSPVSRNGEGSDGIEASISYSYNLQYRNTNFYTNLGMQYRSKEVTPYGIQTWVEDDLSTSAGISYSAEVGVEYPLTTDWVIGSYISYNALSDRSIAARQDTVEDGVRGGLLLTFVF